MCKLSRNLGEKDYYKTLQQMVIFLTKNKLQQFVTVLGQNRVLKSSITYWNFLWLL